MYPVRVVSFVLPIASLRPFTGLECVVGGSAVGTPRLRMFYFHHFREPSTPRFDIGGEDGAGGRLRSDSAAIFQLILNTAANLTNRGAVPTLDSSSSPPAFAPDPGGPEFHEFDGATTRLSRPTAAAANCCKAAAAASSLVAIHAVARTARPKVECLHTLVPSTFVPGA